MTYEGNISLHLIDQYVLVGHSRPLFVYFRSFQTILQNKNYCCCWLGWSHFASSLPDFPEPLTKMFCDFRPGFQLATFSKNIPASFTDKEVF